MSRSLILILGAMCWTAVALNVFVHMIRGDLVAPAIMAVILVGWLAIRGSLILRSRTTAPGEAASAS
jgi:hypothetical protein